MRCAQSAMIERPAARAAGERDLVDVGVPDEMRAGVPVTRQHAEHALRQPGGLECVCDQVCGEWSLGWRLEDNRTTCRERGADLDGR